MGTRENEQPPLWVATSDLPSSPGHPFYTRLNAMLEAEEFDRFVEGQCRRFYAPVMGRPGLEPGRYFRLLMIGYFEGIDSERGIAWRAADSLAVRGFLRLGLEDAAPDHSTISRFENRVGTHALYAMGRALAVSVIDRHRQRLHGRARRITIDLDPTDDPTHGAQQLTFFNGHYDCWCYLPLLAFLTFNDEVEQYLCAAILRPGNASAARGARGTLCRLLAVLRVAFPRARFLVRLDGGFATPEIFDFLDAEPGLDYVVAMGENAVLTRCAEPAMVDARTQSDASGQTEHVYTEARYAAGTWAHARRVVIKAEVVRLPGRDPRDNPRFVVTNLRPSSRFVYEQVYCARGDIENRIKELHDGLQLGRTSCGRFWANQLRVLLTAAAFVLMQELRLRAARTACARTQVTGLRERLLKLGVQVVVSVRRIVLHLPTSTPDLNAWRHIALALGARTG